MSETSRGRGSGRGLPPAGVSKTRAEPVVPNFQDILLIRAAGDNNLAKAIQDHISQGHTLKQVIWTGNLETPKKIPGQILTPDATPTKVGVIPTYLIVFEQLVPHSPQVTLVS